MKMVANPKMRRWSAGLTVNEYRILLLVEELQSLKDFAGLDYNLCVDLLGMDWQEAFRTLAILEKKGLLFRLNKGGYCGYWEGKPYDMVPEYKFIPNIRHMPNRQTITHDVFDQEIVTQ